MMGGRRSDPDNQGKRVQTVLLSVRSMFAERRVQINQSWKEEGFGSLDHALIMCEMMDPYISRSVGLVCAGALKGKYER